MMIDDSNTSMLLHVILFTWSRSGVNHSRFGDLMMLIVQPCKFCNDTGILLNPCVDGAA